MQASNGLSYFISFFSELLYLSPSQTSSVAFLLPANMGVTPDNRFIIDPKNRKPGPPSPPERKKKGSFGLSFVLQFGMARA